MPNAPLIALDVDGVLLDYAAAYPVAWKRAFGEVLQEVNPDAYWPHERYNARRLSVEERDYFRQARDQHFWSSLPAVPGALEACYELHRSGIRLVCVTALEPEFRNARLDNLLSLGFPIEDVIATGSDHAPGVSPKVDALQRLRPTAFVDDYLPYLKGLPRQTTHLALVTRQTGGSPNQGPDLSWADSSHSDLQDFAQWWLRGR